MLALLVALPLTLLAQPAFAACHIAAFVDDSVSVNENAGQVTLTVELVNRQPQCAGSVEYQTVNGTAKAPSDYTSRQGTLSFTAGDDRVETISVPIINDSADEPAEAFTVRLSGGTGGISGDDTATVTINDNDPAPQPTTPRPSSPARSPSRAVSTSPPASVAATPTQSPTPSSFETPAASPSETPPLGAAPAGDTSSNAGAIAALIGALVVLIGAGVWVFRRRRAG